MATKTSKKTSVTHSSVSSSVVTPSSERPSSPLSPTRLTRMQEKIELQNLNDRLATYIDRVRYLEAENNRLNHQVQTSQETITREVTSIKSMYEQELSDARRVLDDTAKDKARLQIDASKFKTEAEELHLKLTKKEKDLAAAEKKLINAENHNQDLQSRANQAVSDRKRFEDLYKEAENEREKMAKQLESAKSQLEEETLMRVDLENRVQSLKEELTFKNSVHEREMSETRVIKQTEISSLDENLKEMYEQKLSDTLKDLRDQYESQLRINREEIESLYENKLSDLQRMLDQYTNTTHSTRDELKTYKSRVDNLSSKLSELEHQNSSLQSRIKDLERLLKQEQEWHEAALAVKEEELKVLRGQMDKQLQEYQDLLDIKVALDMEIAAYRKLLEGEESRLHITPGRAAEVMSQSRATPVRRTPMRGTKRKRTVIMSSEEKSSSDHQVSSSAKGDIEISDHDIDGKYVKLHNKGNSDTSLNMWQLVRKAGDQETVYKFHRTVLKANSSVTVWSSNSGVTHSPPADLVMKGLTWFIADDMTTTLLNNNGEEMALRHTAKKQLSSFDERTRESGSYLDPSQITEEELYHQQGDPQSQEKCAIM